MKKILTVNPGSTSTKLAYFLDDELVVETAVDFHKPTLSRPVHVLDEYDARMNSIREFLCKQKIDLNDIDIFVSRGGAPGRVEYGAYEIDEYVIKLLCFRDAPTYHASNLAPVLAYSLAQEAGGKPAIFYDAVSADMAGPLAHVSGVPGIGRHVGCHNLNTRMVGREAAEKLGKKYEECKIVIAHLGGGISVSAHEYGVIQDSIMCDEGPMGPQRGGRLSIIEVINMCRNGKTPEDMQRITDGGGLLSYFKVDNMIELERRINAGDKEADFLYQAMAYQVAKAVGEMYTVMCCDIDAVVLTGGVANSEMFTGWLRDRLGKMSDILVIPGEREMLALARGGLRVLNGEEELKKYDSLPEGFVNIEDYISHFKTVRKDLMNDPTVREFLTL